MAAAAVVVVMELVETGRVAQVEAAQVAMIQELMPYPERQIEAAVAAAMAIPTEPTTVEAASSSLHTRAQHAAAVETSQHQAATPSTPLPALAPLPTQAKHGTLRRNQRKQDRPARDRRS